MKFPLLFKRYKGSVPSGAIALGGDTIPTDNKSAMDNVLSSRCSSINGWPLSRVVLAANYIGAGAVAALPVKGYVFEDSLGVWLLIPGSATSITPSKNGDATGALVYFDAMTLMDLPNVAKDQGASQPGNATFLFIIGDNSSGDGEYDFAVAAELTTKPF